LSKKGFAIIFGGIFYAKRLALFVASCRRLGPDGL